MTLQFIYVFVFLDSESSTSARTIKMLVTSYGYDDNDPPSAEIAYPTKHSLATEGQGTYDDPITFATDPRELSVGTMIYVPFLQKYFIMEDLCVQAQSDWDQGNYHVDLWMGPQSQSDQGSLYGCEGEITRGASDVIVNPSEDLPVDTTPLFSNNQCTANMHE
jgi:3D (Asp-Asp-Asp) domain-containing protein